MPEKVNPPVHQIIFIGPRRDTLKHAAAFYTVCRERRQIPALYAKRALLGAERQIRTNLVRSGIITVGPQAEALFQRVRQKIPYVKALCLLPPDAPKPKPYFSYRHQIFPYPKTAEDYGLIASWMGLHRCFTEQDIFTEELPHSIPTALLEQEVPK